MLKYQGELLVCVSGGIYLDASPRASHLRASITIVQAARAVKAKCTLVRVFPFIKFTRFLPCPQEVHIVRGARSNSLISHLPDVNPRAGHALAREHSREAGLRSSSMLLTRVVSRLKDLFAL